jgi:hypothetical protein
MGLFYLFTVQNTMRSENRFALRLRYVDLDVSIEVAVEVCLLSLYSVVKQRLKCNTGKVCNCLIQFLYTMILSIEELVFISAQRLSERTVFIIADPTHQCTIQMQSARSVMNPHTLLFVICAWVSQ